MLGAAALALSAVASVRGHPDGHIPLVGAAIGTIADAPVGAILASAVGILAAVARGQIRLGHGAN